MREIISNRKTSVYRLISIFFVGNFLLFLSVFVLQGKFSAGESEAVLEFRDE